MINTKNVLRYEFENYTVLPAERLLLYNGETIHLKPKVLETLLTLITHQGRLLSKNELMKLIWAGNFVEEGNLSQNIFTLRKIFGETPKEHRFIVTVPGQGYRFVAKVRAITETNENSFSDRPAAERNRIKSLVILPFSLFSASEDDKYMGLAIADTLITQLSTNKSVSIFSTAAILKYIESDKDPLTIGQELRADAVVSGTIQKFNQKFRVNIQITRVVSSEMLWANIFELPANDFIFLQDRIAQQAADALTIKLNRDSRSSIRSLKNREVYQLYLKGRYFWEKRSEAGLREALTCAEQVAAAEPDFPLAYVGMADSYLLLGQYLHLAPDAACLKAKPSIDKALELDPALSEGYASLAEYTFFYERDWVNAERNYRRSIELNPNYTSAYHWYAWFLLSMRRFDEAQEQIETAQVLDPNSLIVHTIRGLPFYYRKQFDQAIEQYERILEVDPTLTHANYYLGSALAHSGRIDEAIAEFEKLTRIAPLQQTSALLAYCYGVAGKRARAREILNYLKKLEPEKYVSPYVLAIIHTGLGENQLALEQLERAQTENALWQVWININPVFERLHWEPRFKNLIQKLNFPD